nr:hypothetical protein [Tanacetum cinerariifolium]
MSRDTRSSLDDVNCTSKKRKREEMGVDDNLSMVNIKDKEKRNQFSVRYVDGEVDIFDMVDIEVFNVIELDEMVLQLDYKGSEKHWIYRIELGQYGVLGVFPLIIQLDTTYSTHGKDSICDFVTPRFMPHGLLTPPTDESVITYTHLSGVQGLDTQDHVLPTILSQFSAINLSFISVEPTVNEVIYIVIRHISFDDMELDKEAGFSAVADSSINSFGLCHDDSLPPEWSKFVTNVKLVKDLHTSNYDQLHAYLEQQELHANETEDLDTYDSDCDDLLNAQAVLMANISNYGSDVTSEVPHSETYLNDIENQSVLVMRDFKQPPTVDSTDNEIHSDSNIISLTEDFGKRFTLQQELSAEQAFWLRMSDPTSKPSDALSVKIKAPKELSKISLVNESLKKLKFHLAKFDSVMKMKITPNALTEGKATVDNAAQIPSAITVAPRMFKLDLEPLAPKLMHNRESHIFYLKHTHDQANILQGIVEQAKAKQPLDNELDFACKHAKRIQKLLVYVQDTCPSAIRLRVKCSTSASGSKPSGNTKNNRISQPSSSNKINKVEDQPRSVKTKKNNKNHVKKVKCDDHVYAIYL